MQAVGEDDWDVLGDIWAPSLLDWTNWEQPGFGLWQIGVLGPAWESLGSWSKQTPHCNFPPLKPHLHSCHTDIQCPAPLWFKLQSILKCAFSICQMYVAQWSQGGWNEIGGRYPKGALSIPFFGLNLLQGATKGVSYQCWRDGKGQTVNHILCHGSQIFVRPLKFVKKIW